MDSTILISGSFSFSLEVNTAAADDKKSVIIEQKKQSSEKNM
jgi:hypothetical protein